VRGEEDGRMKGKKLNESERGRISSLRMKGMEIEAPREGNRRIWRDREKQSK